MNQQTFESWRESKNIDCQKLTAEIESALLVQWTNEQMAKQPPTHKLVMLASDQSQWPVRTVREVML